MQLVPYNLSRIAGAGKPSSAKYIRLFTYKKSHTSYTRNGYAHTAFFDDSDFLRLGYLLTGFVTQICYYKPSLAEINEIRSEFDDIRYVTPGRPHQEVARGGKYLLLHKPLDAYNPAIFNDLHKI